MFTGNAPNIILVSCILHSICEVHDDTFNDEWLEDLDLVQPGDVPVSTTTVDGGTVRDLLVNYFENHFK